MHRLHGVREGLPRARHRGERGLWLAVLPSYNHHAMTDLDVLAEGARTLGVNLDDRQFAQYQAYLEGLAAWNMRTNLTSPAALADAERVHLLDSLTLVPIIARKGK